MFSRSISATLASPIAQPTQRALIVSASSVAQLGPNLLGVVEAFQVERPVEDDHRRDHRPSQRPAPDFVGAADQAVPVGPGGIFVAVQANQPALFALACVAAFPRRIVHAAASGGSSNVMRPNFASPKARM